MRVKLSEILDGLKGDSEIKKLAQDAGVAPAEGAAAETQSEDSRMVGDTVEDEKEKIQTKLMELAGLQSESASAANADEALNVAQEAPAGEIASPADISEAGEVAEVVASALGGMKPEIRKQASIAIVQKIAQMSALSVDDLKDIKVASARAGEYDAAGRIMARAYHDEINKLAAVRAKKAAEAAGEEGEETPEETGTEGSEDLTAEELSTIEGLA
jgi:hypothetical protein